jgi:hypothetical protein
MFQIDHKEIIYIIFSPVIELLRFSSGDFSQPLEWQTPNEVGVS